MCSSHLATTLRSLATSCACSWADDLPPGGTDGNPAMEEPMADQPRSTHGRGATWRTPVLLIPILLPMLLLGCQRPPPFDVERYLEEYDQATRNEDLAYFADLYSEDFWFPNRTPNREAALEMVRQEFESHGDLQASLEVDSLSYLPGGRSLIMNVHLRLEGRRDSDGELVTLFDRRGSCVFVFERGRWREYKVVTRELEVPGG